MMKKLFLLVGLAVFLTPTFAYCLDLDKLIDELKIEVEEQNKEKEQQKLLREKQIEEKKRAEYLKEQQQLLEKKQLEENKKKEQELLEKRLFEEYKKVKDSLKKQIERRTVDGTREDLIVKIGDRVFFNSGESYLNYEAMKLLQEQAVWLEIYNDVIVTIEGHSDNKGTRNEALIIGKKRALSVKNYLISLGIDASRINIVSYGKERPAVIGDSEAALGQNRRAVTTLSFNSKKIITTQNTKEIPKCSGLDDFRKCHIEFEFANGKYVGERENRKRNGQGTYIWTDGEKYVGEWKNNKKHGQGTYTWTNGQIYIGEWKDGKYHQGALTLASGDKYVGEWKDRKMHGQGALTFASGDKYVGEWKDAKFHGQGTYTWSDGKKYVGAWKDDIRYGQGTLTLASGKKESGEWISGILIKKEKVRTTKNKEKKPKKKQGFFKSKSSIYAETRGNNQEANTDPNNRTSNQRREGSRERSTGYKAFEQKWGSDWSGPPKWGWP